MKPSKINIKEVGFEVNVCGYSEVLTAKTLEEAKKKGMKLLKQKQTEWEQMQIENKIEEKRRKENLYSFQHYHKVLRNRYDYIFKDIHSTPSRADILRIVKELRQISMHELEVDYSSFSHKYFLKAVEKNKV